ncbi:MAG: hypothetical protein AAGD14_11590, partial [Planctomycetota bacterium]
KSLETQGLFVEPAWIEKVIVFDAQGNAMEHRFPLDESEKKLSTLKSAPVKPLSEKDLRAGRRMVRPRDTSEFERGVTIPFPADLANPDEEKPEGERRVESEIGGTDETGTTEKKEDGG